MLPNEKNDLLYLESVHNVDTLWTDYLENRIFAAFRRENARSVRKVTDFVDRHYLINILEHIGKIWKYTEKTNDAEELFELNDQLNLNASLTLLANIGENVSKISDNLKQEYLDIEWQKIKDFRNRIIHNYVGIDMAIVYEIIKNDLKTLKPEIVNIIKEKLKQKIFDIEEIEICKESKYYRNIDFKEIL